MLVLMSAVARVRDGDHGVRTSATPVRASAASHTVPVSKGGQISLPAEIRHRWGASRLVLIDHGDSVEVRPLPDDPIAAARGILRRDGATPSEVLRARERRADAERMERAGRPDADRLS
jgi:bifunctional DNA-binding transcriptional regulator/antitoxin component of YhaV-PrlF toxin-antitoxin module